MKNLYCIGTVVEVEKKKIMIMGILAKQNDTIFDYVAVDYPNGYFGSDCVYYFNNEDIDNVLKVGYVDHDMISYMNNIRNKGCK